MRYARVIAIVGLALALPLAIGWGGKDKEGEDLGQAERIVKMVKMAYEGASKPESAIIMAELAIFDLGKKNRINDAPAELDKVLSQVKKPALRNFTRFLIAASYGEQKNTAKAVETLQALVSENAPRVGSDDGGSAPREREAK